MQEEKPRETLDQLIARAKREASEYKKKVSATSSSSGTFGMMQYSQLRNENRDDDER